MAIVMATFTNSRDAERAAAALRTNGFSGLEVGTTAGDIGDLLGMGLNETKLRNRIVFGSAIAGAVALGAFGFLLGMFSMDTPDIRGQGTVASIGPALTSLLMFLLGLATVGGIGGLLGGFLSAGFIGKAVSNSVADGEAPRRPLLTVPVQSRQQEDTVHVILNEIGPPFEVVVR